MKPPKSKTKRRNKGFDETHQEMIETAVRNGVSFMPRFRKTEISNADLAAIVAYLVHK